mgnify:CR=1 FL=1
MTVIANIRKPDFEKVFGEFLYLKRETIANVDAIVEDRKSPAELIKNGADPGLVDDLYQRIRLHEYKRRQAAPGLRVSAKAFGVGRRIPIVNHYKGK